MAKNQIQKKNKPQEIKKSIFPFDFLAAIILIGLLLILLTIYFVKRIHDTDKVLIPISVLALIAGLIYEYKSICEKWITVLLTTLVSFALSFLAFLPGKREHNYSLDSHIEAWPYTFCFFFTLIAICFYTKKTTPILTEGITLLQSIAIIYWVIDIGSFDPSNMFVFIFTIIGVIYSILTIFNAFSYSELSRNTRYHLSIWSTLIMAILASDNIYRLYSGDQIEATQEFHSALFIFGQYFLLGVSSIYIVQNFYMLLEFLPNRNSNYKKDYKELKKRHIERYSIEQIKKSHALLCIIFASFIFYLNYYYKLFPRNFVIWSVFLLFPLIIHFINQRRKRYS